MKTDPRIALTPTAMSEITDSTAVCSTVNPVRVNRRSVLRAPHGGHAATEFIS